MCYLLEKRSPLVKLGDLLARGAVFLVIFALSIASSGVSGYKNIHPGFLVRHEQWKPVNLVIHFQPVSWLHNGFHSSLLFSRHPKYGNKAQCLRNFLPFNFKPHDFSFSSLRAHDTEPSWTRSFFYETSRAMMTSPVIGYHEIVVSRLHNLHPSRNVSPEIPPHSVTRFIWENSWFMFV